MPIRHIFSTRVCIPTRCPVFWCFALSAPNASVSILTTECGIHFNNSHNHMHDTLRSTVYSVYSVVCQTHTYTYTHVHTIHIWSERASKKANCTFFFEIKRSSSIDEKKPTGNTEKRQQKLPKKKKQPLRNLWSWNFGSIQCRPFALVAISKSVVNCFLFFHF